jgi:hypothetical protein
LKPTKKKGFTRRKKNAKVSNVEIGYKGKKNYQTQSYQTPFSQISSINSVKPLMINQHTNPLENQVENNPTRAYQRNQEQLSPLLMPLGEMYIKLLSMSHVAPLLCPPLRSHFLNWYKPNLTYEYHANNPSQNIDICSAFKRKLLQLFKAR